ncbi:hypothetical protein PACILC2_41450 [Paenibacillus cisolokensis]|uniref:AraC family transcriptional regulator n=1 Tax=Paenibacillus cisolokensis TaxID=1658519 RepID=A0ABQ4NBJ8_9BACL|nr:response regulator [Paenibacillus cisolokensis]GIQ65577.1 hypothetical protein PACILC2_41450 [Paenibacillus cisolokensis]
MTKLDNRQRFVNMLIVDDEPIICEGLRYTIEWEKFGVSVVGEAYDGEEALRIIREQEVDFVLSDVRMDGMDGIQLAEQLNLHYPHIRLVIISGYEEFEYARRAMRVGVKDYLLKPVRIDELIQVVQDIVASVRKNKAATNKEEHLLWFSGMIKDAARNGQAVPPSLKGGFYRLIASQWKDFAERFSRLSADDYQNMQERWLQWMDERLISHGIRSISVFDHKNMLFTLAIADTELSDSAWRLLLEDAMQGWDGSGGLCCGVSAAFRELEQTGARSAEAREALLHHVLTDGTVLFPDDPAVRKLESKPDIPFKDWVQSIVSALFKQDPGEIRSLVGSFFAALKNRRLLLPDAVRVYDELLVLLRLRLRQSGLNQPEQSRGASIDLNVYNSYSSIETLALNEMEQLMRLVDQSGIDKSFWIIERAKKYLSEHYRDDVKASEIAEWLKITPSYFSLLFKQSTGKSFKEYMNELRMEQAKHLLATTHEKVFEIANEVGYKEYKYFVSVFKSYTGMTPKEYRALTAAL